jgi:phage repressor protein C with HTH and peptisase S24 domain
MAKKLTQEQMGVSKALMSQYESGLTMPKPQTLAEFADRLGVSVDELLGRSVNPSSSAHARTKYVYPRSYEDIVLAASPTGQVFEDYHVELNGSVPIPTAALEKRGWQIERLALQWSKGMSMYPTIGDGEPLIVNLDEVKLISGKLYAIIDPENGLRVKRLYDTGDGRVRVVSDNPDKFTFADSFITPDTQAKIVGRAYRLGDLYSGQS